RQEARFLEPLPQLDVVFDERAGDAEAERAGLAGGAAAGDGGEHVELLGRFGHDERLLDLRTERFGGEGLLERLAIAGHAAGARTEEHACGRGLPAPRAVVLNACCHVMRPRAWLSSEPAASAPRADDRHPHTP